MTYTREFTQTQPLADSIRRPSGTTLANYLRKKLLARAGKTQVRLLTLMSDVELVEAYRLHEEERTAIVTITKPQTARRNVTVMS